MLSGSGTRTIKTSSGGSETTLEASETLDLTAGTNVTITEAAGVVTINSTSTGFDQAGDYTLTGSIDFTPGTGKTFPTIKGTSPSLIIDDTSSDPDPFISFYGKNSDGTRTEMVSLLATEQSDDAELHISVREMDNDNVSSLEISHDELTYHQNFAEKFTVNTDHTYVADGIRIGGTTEVNQLDDYEEGTWTPTASGLTLSSVSGRYTKVGRLVTAPFRFTVPTTTSTANFTIPDSSLPFSHNSHLLSGPWNADTSAGINSGTITEFGSSIGFSSGSTLLLTRASLSGKIVYGVLIYETT